MVGMSVYRLSIEQVGVESTTNKNSIHQDTIRFSHMAAVLPMESKCTAKGIIDNIVENFQRSIQSKYNWTGFKTNSDLKTNITINSTYS